MNVPYPQILSDMTHLQAPDNTVQEVVNENRQGDEFGIGEGYGKWNIRVTWVRHGGYKGNKKSTDLVLACRSLFSKLKKSGNYTDIPLKHDGASFPTYDVADGVPTLSSSVYNAVTGEYTYTLNSDRSDLVVDMYMKVIYKGHPRLLQIWQKPEANKMVTFPSLPLADGTRFEPADIMRVKLPDKAGIGNTLIVEQGKVGAYPRISRDFTEFNGGL